ncbi:MAG: hypothetical protein ABEL76_10220 [Bradymonadaceae bacterium]
MWTSLHPLSATPPRDAGLALLTLLVAGATACLPRVELTVEDDQPPDQTNIVRMKTILEDQSRTVEAYELYRKAEDNVMWNPLHYEAQGPNQTSITPDTGTTATYEDEPITYARPYKYRATALLADGDRVKSPTVTHTHVPDSPLTGHYVVFFEDQKGEGDADFDYNDFVVEIETTVRFHEKQTGDGIELPVDEITIEFTPYARGSQYDHEFRQRIPLAGKWEAQLSYSGGTFDDNDSRSSGTIYDEQGETGPNMNGDLVADLFDTIRDFPPDGGPSGVDDWNTDDPEPSDVELAGQATLTVDLQSEKNLLSNLVTGPWDVKLCVRDCFCEDDFHSRGLACNREGKVARTGNYHGRGEPAPEGSGGAGRMLNFALVLPGEQPDPLDQTANCPNSLPDWPYWPRENTAIWDAFPQFWSYRIDPHDHDSDHGWIGCPNRDEIKYVP